MRPLDTKPPSDTAYEMAVIGFLMRQADPSVYSRLEGVVKPEYFHKESLRYAFDAAMSIGQGGGVITAHTVEVAMKSRGLGDYIDGPDFFSECKNAAVGSIEDSLWFVAELRKLYLRRQLIESAKSIVRISNNAELEEADMIGAALEAIMAVGQDSIDDKGVRSIGEIIDNGVREQVDAITGLASVPMRYISTGLSDLDYYIRGWRKSGLHLITAPTGLGKSLFVEDQALILASSYNSSLIFTTEMADEDVVTRQIFMVAGIDEHDVRKDPSEVVGLELSHAMNIAADMPIYFKDSADLTIEKLEVTIHQEMRRGRRDVIIVDHFHELRTERKFSRADEPLEYIAGRLKIIARTYDVPVLCVVQQNRGNHEGNLNAALKGTSALEQKADVIMFFQAISDDGEVYLTPDEARQRAGEQGWVRVKARVTKVRSGGMTGTADLVMDWKKGGRYTDWDKWAPLNEGRIARSNLLNIRNSAT